MATQGASFTSFRAIQYPIIFQPKISVSCPAISMELGASTYKLSLAYPSTGSNHARRRRGDWAAVRMAGTPDLAAYEQGQLEKPKWVGDTLLSRLVKSLISFKPLYSVLKLGARQVFISTAEKKNIPWRDMTKEILESDVYMELQTVENPSVVYPDYYLSPFHAYDEGNLSWLAAAEAEAATMSMAKRAIPDGSLEEANKIMRGNWLQVIEQHHLQYSGNSVIEDILDIGCSVGVSTRYLANRFPSAKVTGLDLSPYFLAVAQFKEKQGASRKNPITWMHKNGEDTGLPSKSFDLVSFSYVSLCPFNSGHGKISSLSTSKDLHEKGNRKGLLPWPLDSEVDREKLDAQIMPSSIKEFQILLHECPERAIIGLVQEAFRLLRPGGTIVLTDQAPNSKIIQELSPVLFTLLKSTEPFLDEYYLTDLETRLREAGFTNVQAVLTDPRHRTMTATVPR